MHNLIIFITSWELDCTTWYYLIIIIEPWSWLINIEITSSDLDFKLNQ